MKEYKRNCPICNKEIIHKHYVSYRESLKKNKQCSKCANIERANRPEEKIKNSQRQKNKNIGINNHFYGKKHTEETKKIIKEFRKKQIIPKGEKHPKYGKKLEEIVGIKKAIEIKQKLSLKNRGVNNPMYGKPSPMGSGNGWSGWYKGWYFRSIMELSYMIKVIERFGLLWQNGEQKKYKINYYDDNGVSRNYFPDFIINNKYMIEIKPNKLKKTLKILEKTKAAIDFCNKNNMKFKITNLPKLTDNELKYLIENNKIELTSRYIQKYKEKYGVNHN
jgi:hypothetical protein